MPPPPASGLEVHCESAAGNVHLSLYPAGLRRGHPRLALRGAARRAARFEALLDDRRRPLPRQLRRAGGRGRLRLRAAGVLRAGRGGLGLPAAAHRGAQPHRGGRRHRGALGLGACHRHCGHEPHHGHDHGCGQLYVRQHPRHVARRRGALGDAGSCRAGALYPLLPSTLCRHVRRELFPRDGREGGRLPFAPRAAHGADGRARNAHDGRHAHLQPHYLPRALGHAHFQELPRGGRVRGRAERGVLLHGADRLVPPLHAGRRERGALQSARVPALLPCGTEITKENSETRSPLGASRLAFVVRRSRGNDVR